MAGEAKVLDLLGAVQAHQRDAGHSWAVDVVLMTVKRRVLNLADRGLLELADREERAALSAWEGRPVRWAARLAPPGHDLLLYTCARPRQMTHAEAEPGRRRVELCLSQMAVLLLAVSLADRLQQPLAEGLADEVRAARCDHLVKRWVLHLTEDQLASVAYMFWLHKTTGSAAEANRFTRDTGITYQPAPTPRTAVPPSVPILHRQQTPTTPPSHRS
ncbi:DUF6417 family protein [Streptomyces sp. NPDC005811]|uniref:DUF6417 family protein n=1 Tax=Streptomyces sp. NPDC005811 TaxID=3154565 RepID=UPI003410F994